MPGDTVTYSIVVKNVGHVDFTDLVVKDTLKGHGATKMSCYFHNECDKSVFLARNGDIYEGNPPHRSVFKLKNR